MLPADLTTSETMSDTATIQSEIQAFGDHYSYDASYLAEGVAPHAAPFLVITPSAAAVVGDVYVYA